MKLLLTGLICTGGVYTSATNLLICNNNRQQYIGINNTICNNIVDSTNHTIAIVAMILLQYFQNLLKPINFYHFLSKPVNFANPVIPILEICNTNIDIHIALLAEVLLYEKQSKHTISIEN